MKTRELSKTRFANIAKQGMRLGERYRQNRLQNQFHTHDQCWYFYDEKLTDGSKNHLKKDLNTRYGGQSGARRASTRKNSGTSTVFTADFISTIRQVGNGFHKGLILQGDMPFYLLGIKRQCNGVSLIKSWALPSYMHKAVQHCHLKSNLRHQKLLS